MLCDFDVTEIESGVYRHQCKREGCGVVRQGPWEKLVRTCNVIGLGDRIAMALKKVGVRPTKTCNCKERQDKLNEIGEKLIFWR